MMTNEEAIEVLKNDIEICTIQQEQACDMAIKALEDKGYEQGYADGFAECLELNT